MNSHFLFSIILFIIILILTKTTPIILIKFAVKSALTSKAYSTKKILANYYNSLRILHFIYQFLPKYSIIRQYLMQYTLHFRLFRM